MTVTKRLLTGEALAVRFDVVPSTIRSWVRRGCPVAERGRRGDKTRPSRYLEADVRRWLRERDAEKRDSHQARARRERAHAILAEQTVRIRAAELIPRVEAERAWAVEVAAVRANLRAWVKPLARRIHKAAKDGLPGVEAGLKTAVHEKLTELAEAKKG